MPGVAGWLWLVRWPVSLLMQDGGFLPECSFGQDEFASGQWCFEQLWKCLRRIGRAHSALGSQACQRTDLGPQTSLLERALIDDVDHVRCSRINTTGCFLALRIYLNYPISIRSHLRRHRLLHPSGCCSSTSAMRRCSYRSSHPRLSLHHSDNTEHLLIRTAPERCRPH